MDNGDSDNGFKYLPLTSISTNKLANREVGCIEKILVSVLENINKFFKMFTFFLLGIIRVCKMY